MIRAICLNPVIDRSYQIDNFVAGAQYINSIATECIGGKGLNVAKVCKLLQEPVTLYTFTGGETGKQICNRLLKQQIDLRNIELDESSRISINIIDARNRSETEVLERGPSVSPPQMQRMLDYLKQDIATQDIVVCAGVLIDGAPLNIYAQISEICNRVGARCVLDTNRESLKQSVSGHYFLGKPNQYELATLLDMLPTDNIAKLRSMAAGLMGNIYDNLLISMGAQGALLLTDTRCYVARVPDVPVVSTVGCGDSTLAGFVVGITRGWDALRSFRLAMACGVANSTSHLVAAFDSNLLEDLCNRIEIHEL